MLVKMRQTRLKPLGAVPSPQLPPQAGKSRQEAPIGGNRRFRGPQYYVVTERMCNPGWFIILKLSAHHFRHRARIMVRQ
jgi:hypothetical protein